MKCFDEAPVFSNTIAITISQEKDGSAYLAYWFTGYGDDGETEIPYLFEMLDGVFDGDWRPAPAGMTTTAFFTADLESSWEMSINGKNESACTNTGDFTSMQTIEVLNTTP